MKKYLITSAEFYTQEQKSFQKKLQMQISKHKPDFLLYRDKENENYAELARTFIDVSQKNEGLKYFLHQDSTLAKELGATGVHLNSTQFDQITKAKELGLEVLISTHSYDEVKKAQDLGADYVTYSPIFHSPNKGEPKGIADLKELIEQVDIKVFALGGIVTQEHIKQVADANAFGFASIRYFY